MTQFIRCLAQQIDQCRLCYVCTFMFYSAPLPWQHHGFFFGHGPIAINAAHSVGGLSGAVLPQPIPTSVPQTTQQSLEEPERVRTVFPETWLWSNSVVGYTFNYFNSRRRVKVKDLYLFFIPGSGTVLNVCLLLVVWILMSYSLVIVVA